MKFKTDRLYTLDLQTYLTMCFELFDFFLLEKGRFGLGTPQGNGVIFYKNRYIKFQLIFCE